jgi:hypothetical protein
MKDWTINKMNDVALLEIQVPDKPATNKWEKWILLTSDWHWDNAHCDLNLLKRDLNQAVERDAPVLAFGDLFCLMQGRYDPRRSRSGMRADLDQDNYLDCVVNKAHEWMQPYKDNFCFASRGNHEISNLRNNDTDVIERFCERMRFTGSNIVTGGIGGWIFIRCILNNRKYTLKVAYHHGAGGGGPVTKGVIKANRRSQYLPQADFVVSGHIHERWAVTNVQEHVSDKGKRSLKEQTHISLPTYKQEYHPDGYDFHVLNERPPKPLGGCWLRLHYVSHDSGATPKAEIIFT